MYAGCDSLRGAAVHVQKQLRQAGYCSVDKVRIQHQRCRSLLQLFGLQLMIIIVVRILQVLPGVK